MADAASGADRDWRHFYDTARLVLDGRASEIYPGHTQGLPFLHPPYFVWAILPFGLLSRTGGYLASTAASIFAMAAAMWFLQRVLPGDLKRFGWAVLAVLGSASWTVALALGQPSPWYLLFICATLFLWTRGQPVRAGMIISLMMLKPNLGLVFPLLFVARGERRMLLGWLAGFSVLLLSTIPLGATVWMRYLEAMRTVSAIVDQIPTWRQHTIAAFWWSFVHTPRLRTALWLACALPLAALTGWAWLKADRKSSALPRLLGITVLMAVTCSPYLHHYDVIIVSLPGMVWYLSPRSFRSATLRQVCGASLLAAYLIQQVSLWGMQGGLSLVGPVLAVWLVADALDLAAGEVGAAPSKGPPAIRTQASPAFADGGPRP
ncbi:MAG: glycosyltransferase family 87 protein [Polyangia bacterium]